MSRGISFIHLTDTHITAEGRNIFPDVALDTYSRFQAVIQAIATMDILPDFFVISGDLTHEGDEPTYRRFKLLVDDLKAHFGAPVLCALGNHDRRGPFRAAMFDQPDSDEHVPYYYSRVIRDLRVLVLDTRVPGQETGALDMEQLTWLGDTLSDPFTGSTLLVCHHPPIDCPLPFLKHRSLTNAGDLASVLEGHAIAGILCGHIHYHAIGLFEGIPCAAGTGVAFTLDPTAAHGMRLMGGSGFNLVNVSGGLMTVNPMMMPGELKELAYFKTEKTRANGKPTG